MEATIRLSKEDVVQIVGKYFGLRDVYVEIVNQVRYVQVPAHLYGPDYDRQLNQESDDTLVVIHKKC